MGLCACPLPVHCLCKQAPNRPQTGPKVACAWSKQAPNRPNSGLCCPCRPYRTVAVRVRRAPHCLLFLMRAGIEWVNVNSAPNSPHTATHRHQTQTKQATKQGTKQATNRPLTGHHTGIHTGKTQAHWPVGLLVLNRPLNKPKSGLWPPSESRARSTSPDGRLDQCSLYIVAQLRWRLL